MVCFCADWAHSRGLDFHLIHRVKNICHCLVSHFGELIKMNAPCYFFDKANVFQYVKLFSLRTSVWKFQLETF